MIHKFSQFRFDEKFLVFLKLYLLGGQQRVVIANLTSSYSNVSSKGPQGIIFSVFLFSVYINDLPEVFLNESFLFADDKKIVGSETLRFHSLKSLLVYNSDESQKQSEKKLQNI